MKKPPLPVFICAISVWLAACTPVQTQTADGVLQETPGAVPTPWPTPEPAISSTPAKAERRYSYNSVNTGKRVVAMTFDDGPHPTLTPKLLDLLKARNIKATFYVVGRNAELYPQIMRRMVDEGHEVANHTWTHPALTKCSPAKMASEIQRTTDIIRKTTGKEPTNMRPPYGAINSGITKRLNEEYGLPVIMWSVDPLDWRRPGPSVVAKRIVDGAHPGAIILAHDIHPGTIEAMPRALDELKARGYGFVTVSELIELDEVKSTPTPSPTPTPEPSPEVVPEILFASPTPAY